MAAQAIEFYTIKYAWVPKDLYTTYNIKLQLVVFADDDEEEIAEAELADMSKATLKLLCSCVLVNVCLTFHAQQCVSVELQCAPLSSQHLASVKCFVYLSDCSVWF